jgi:hypothetical protein
VTSYPLPNHYLADHTTKAESDWHVLVLFADDTEATIKGLWGPYTSFDIATSAMDELRQWPLDGYWDIRRLNKFLAAKSGVQTPDTLSRAFTWTTSGA